MSHFDNLNGEQQREVTAQNASISEQHFARFGESEKGQQFKVKLAERNQARNAQERLEAQMAREAELNEKDKRRGR